MMRVWDYIVAAVFTAFALAIPMESRAVAAAPMEEECDYPYCLLIKTEDHIYEYRLKIDADRWEIVGTDEGYFIGCASCGDEVQTVGRIGTGGVHNIRPGTPSVEDFRRLVVRGATSVPFHHQGLLGAKMVAIGGFEPIDVGPMKGFSHRFTARTKKGVDFDLALTLASDEIAEYYLLVLSRSATPAARSVEIRDLINAADIIRVRHKRPPEPPPPPYRPPTTQDLLRGYSEEEIR